MTNVIVTLEEHPASADLQAVYQTIADENLAVVGDWGYQRLTLFARDDAGQIVGGLYGFTDRQWLRIELLVVNAAVRQQGIGSALLRAAEHEARRRGCGNVWLDTFSWQARPFYEQHGYRVFGTLDAYPEHPCALRSAEVACGRVGRDRLREQADQWRMRAVHRQGR